MLSSEDFSYSASANSTQWTGNGEAESVVTFGRMFRDAGVECFERPTKRGVAGGRERREWEPERIDVAGPSPLSDEAGALFSAWNAGLDGRATTPVSNVVRRGVAQ